VPLLAQCEGRGRFASLLSLLPLLCSPVGFLCLQGLYWLNVVSVVLRAPVPQITNDIPEAGHLDDYLRLSPQTPTLLASILQKSKKVVRGLLEIC
jgi:hypothetical protein